MDPKEREAAIRGLMAMGFSRGEAEAEVDGQSEQVDPKATFVWIPGRRERKPSGKRLGSTIEGEDVAYESTGEEVATGEVSSWIYDDSRLPAIVVYLAGLGFQINSFQDIENAWMGAVKRASSAYMSSGGRLKKSPWDMLALVAPVKNLGAKDKRFPWKGRAFDQTTTTTNISEIAPETAKEVLSRSLTDLLGRAPSDEEVEDFASRANAIVSANPQVTETTSHMKWDPNAGIDDEGNPVGDYISTGQTERQIGPSEEDVSNMVAGEAKDEAMESPEYGAYQAAGPMFNALLQAIMSPVSGG